MTKEAMLSTTENPCREYSNVWERLGVLDDREDSLLTLDVSRLVVPASQRSHIMDVIHLSHQGITKSYAAARSRYYWKSMKEDIQKVTESCETCTEINPRPKGNPQLDPETAKGDLQPFESVGCDMYSWQGNNYFLVVDRLSGYIFVENMKQNASCAKVTSSFKLLCLTYGMTKSVRYDKGPTFSSEFERFLTDIKVPLTPSSAGNPMSNGLAKSNVRCAKFFLRKSLQEKQNYCELLCY